MIYPSTGGAPHPNPDMPELIKKDYNEARDVVTRSPRSACLLLRLCVQKICDEKVPGRDDLNAKIGKLVEHGLDDGIRKACDSVRVMGGEAAHPLQLDLTDDKNTATALFRIVNHISHWAHTRKREIDEIYKLIPESKTNAISARDTKS